MPIEELGYRHWEGKRTRPAWRWLAIARSEIAIAFQSSKLLRRFLVFAWFPILYYCPVFFAIGYVADPSNNLEEGAMLTGIATELVGSAAIEQIRAQPEVFLPAAWSVAFYYFFSYSQAFFAMIVVAIVGPPLISKDTRSKAFLVYFSKPIGAWQYLLGKLGTVCFFVFCLSLFPALLLYIIGVALSPDVGTLIATLPILLQVLASSLVNSIPIAMMVLLLSSLTKDRRIATFFWIAVWIFGEISYKILYENLYYANDGAVSFWINCLSMRQLIMDSASGIFDLRGNLAQVFAVLGDNTGDLADFMNETAREFDEPGALGIGGSAASSITLGSSMRDSIGAISALMTFSAISAFALMRRVTKPVRI